MTLKQWRNEALKRLTHAPDARVETLWMLADVLNTTPTRVRLMPDEPLGACEAILLERWLSAREIGVPLQYAQGRAHFMGHEFCVDGRVLIPRQDTELLCEHTIERARRGCPDVLELCTGSGAVAISVKLAAPNARVTATDISAGALDVARENAARMGAEVELLRGDLFEPVRGRVFRVFDVIACNPPYLSARDMDELQTEVRHEPALALYGGEDGLDFYRRAAARVRDHLKPGGTALFEVGAGQAEAVNRLLGGECAVYHDLNGIGRVIALTIQ